MTSNGESLRDLIAGRLEIVNQTIQAHSPHPNRVTIVAVSKKFSQEVIKVAYDLGLRDFGENYSQELQQKSTELADLDLRWHFIGGLQRNKVKKLVGIAAVWHTVDRPELVDEVAKRSPGASIFVQVNSTDESQKSGCLPNLVPSLVSHAKDAGLDVRGLMTMGPSGGGSPIESFKAIASLNRQLQLEDLSIGMSGDYKLALEAGSTSLRLGTALFGDRS